MYILINVTEYRIKHFILILIMHDIWLEKNQMGWTVLGC